MSNLGVDRRRARPHRHPRRPVVAVPTAGGRRARRTPCGRSSPPARRSSRARASTWAGSRRSSASTARRCSAGSATATRCCPRSCGRSPSPRSSRPRPRRATPRAPPAWPACSRTSPRDLITADYFRGFLQREPARALRLLTTKESEIQRRYVAVVEALVRQELGDEPFGRGGDRARPGLPAGPHLGVVHVRRPHQRRPAQRGAGARGLRAGAAAMTYPHTAPFATRWNDNDVYGHLNNTVYYEAMDTTINVWLMSVGRPRPDRGRARSASASRRRASSRPPPRSPSRSRWACGPAASGRSSVTWELGILRDGRAAGRGSLRARVRRRRDAPPGADPRRGSVPRSSATWSSDRVAYRPGGMTTCHPERWSTMTRRMPDPPGLDVARLEAYLRREHPDVVGDGTLSARVIAGGRSNLTYRVDGGLRPARGATAAARARADHRARHGPRAPGHLRAARVARARAADGRPGGRPDGGHGHRLLRHGPRRRAPCSRTRRRTRPTPPTSCAP